MKKLFNDISRLPQSSDRVEYYVELNNQNVCFEASIEELEDLRNIVLSKFGYAH